MRNLPNHPGQLRRGMAIGLVLMIGLIVLVLGIAMLATSGNLLRGTVDAKQRLRSRYAAEAMVAIQMAHATEKASQVFGSDLVLDSVGRRSLLTGEGEEAEAKIVTVAGSKAKPVQELITFGDYKGLKGLKIPLLIKSTGYAPGGAKTYINAEIRMYQIPIFQFGVFYEGNLEITPGPNMTVGGPVHTNKNAYFRAHEPTKILSIQGPVTASESIYQWTRGGVLRYLYSPADTTKYFEVPSLTNILTPATVANLPPAVNGIFNVTPNAPKLTLPIGNASPISLIGPRQSSDSAALARQKFDNKIDCSSGCPNRFVNGVTPKPDWISNPKIFFDRREQTWVKIWDFDVKAMSSRSLDSIFYLLDTVWSNFDHAGTQTRVLNAFRIVRGDSLPRNLTIASYNPVYVLGNFNVPQASGPCHPADVSGSVANEDKYCNAMIAANAVTLLSPFWPKLAADSIWGYKNGQGSLEQPLSASGYPTMPDPPYAEHINDIYAPNSSFRVNAAILTGNKPTPLAILPPSVETVTEASYETTYEGGWHNTIRFLEDLTKVDLFINGSFVCVWEALFPGLRTAPFPRVYGSSLYYMPPNRIWTFDPRFSNLNNMPPGTPYLVTSQFSGWSEPR